MKQTELSYGPKGFEEIKTFISENPILDAHQFVAYDIETSQEVFISCPANLLLPAIAIISKRSGDFPRWIQATENHYLVAIRFNGLKFAPNTPYVFQMKPAPALVPCVLDEEDDF